jgi:hypothetical protein
MRAYGRLEGLEVETHSFLNLAQHGVNGQLHSAARLPLKKELLVSIEEEV